MLLDLDLGRCAEIARVKFRLHAAACGRAAVRILPAFREIVRLADSDMGDLRSRWIGLAECPKAVANVEDIVTGELNAAEDEDKSEEGRRDPKLDVADRLLVAVFQPEPGNGLVAQQHGD